jgi:hypothetical protein
MTKLKPPPLACRREPSFLTGRPSASALAPDCQLVGKLSPPRRQGR